MTTNDRSRTPVDLGILLDTAPWSTYQKWVLGLSAIAFAVDGLANQVLGVAIPSLVAAWGVPRAEFASVAAAGLLGVALGTVGGGVLGDRIGRRWGLIAAMTLFGLATVATSLVHGVDALMALRFLDGLGIGGAIPSGAALISEFTPHRRRSRAIALGMVFIPVGGFLAGTLGSIILPGLGWRAYFLAAGILPLVAAVLFLFLLPESPRFMRLRQARKGELLTLLGRFGHRFESDTEFVDHTDDAQAERAPVKALLGPKVLRNTLGIWGAFFFCLMASYTMFSWVPTMLAGLHFDSVVTSIAISAFNFGGMLGGASCGFLIEKYGSRRSLTVLALGSIAAAVGLADRGLRGIARSGTHDRPDGDRGYFYRRHS